MSNNIIWYYTNQKQFERIQKYKILKKSKADEVFGLRSAVWFSRNQKRELNSSIQKYQGITSYLTDAANFWLTDDVIRLGIPFDRRRFTSWRNYKLHNGNNHLQQSIEIAMAFTQSHCKNWYCLFYDVHLSEITHFQKFDNGQFVDIN